MLVTGTDPASVRCDSGDLAAATAVIAYYMLRVLRLGNACKQLHILTIYEKNPGEVSIAFNSDS